MTIVVSSSALSQKYYEEYLDSLNSLGWVCRDTASNYSEHFCTATMQKTFQLVNKKEEGLVCTEE